MSDLHVSWDDQDADDEARAREIIAKAKETAGWSHLYGDVRNTWHWFPAGEERALCGYHPNPRWLTVRQADDSQLVWSAFKCRHCEKRLAKQQTQA